MAHGLGLRRQDRDYRPQWRGHSSSNLGLEHWPGCMHQHTQAQNPSQPLCLFGRSSLMTCCNQSKPSKHCLRFVGKWEANPWKRVQRAGASLDSILKSCDSSDTDDVGKEATAHAVGRVYPAEAIVTQAVATTRVYKHSHFFVELMGCCSMPDHPALLINQV